MQKVQTCSREKRGKKMSEYPIGLNGEMVHCLDYSEYAVFCRNKLEREVEKEVEDER